MIRALVVARAMFVAAVVLAGVGAPAQAQMPDPRAMSGVPRPDPTVPAGTLSVRVIRGNFNNLVGQPVEVIVDGRSERLRTGEDGRVQRAGLAPGTRVKAVVEVGGERLETQEIVMGADGIRVLLAAADSDQVAKEAEARRLAEGPAQQGLVVLGPETRVIAEMQDDRLNIFYVLQILNNSRAPVDIGGPLLFDLPREARGAGIMDGSSPQATTQGPRVIVTGPFAPGSTNVQVGFELPYRGPNVRLEQQWPAAMQQVNMLIPKMAGVDLVSSQFQSKRDVADPQGQMLVVAQGPAIAAGSSLVVDITGLPHHPTWPRNVALGLAGLICTIGLWVAFVPRRRA